MIFLKLFWVFTKIGIVNFGGGYAMLSLIQAEVVQRQGWLTAGEFTDIVAISQMTPGPIGINAATYIGYSAVVSAGYPPILGILGSTIATLSVVWLPFILMFFLSYLLLRYKNKPWIRSVFSTLRPTIIGLIASAALLLMTEDNFGNPNTSLGQFVASALLFTSAFVAVYRYRANPLLVLSCAAGLGILIYGLVLQ